MVGVAPVPTHPSQQPWSRERRPWPRHEAHVHNGYPALDVCGRRHVRVHTLVLETFIGPRSDGLECCHFDGVKENCRMDNLRWDDKVRFVK
jgi:HNH endonuclease